MTKYAIIAALLALSASVALNGWQRHINASVTADNERLSASLATCSARIKNIQEDKESDATVIDPNDYVVPDIWMRPAGTSN